MSAPDSQFQPPTPRDRTWWLLLGAALLTRLVWVLWLHPPQDHVFSDMAHYVHRARLVAGFEVEPGMRKMVWQAWGTHTLLAIPMLLLGPGRSALEFAGLVWAACSAASVVLGYELAWHVLPRGRSRQSELPTAGGDLEGDRAPHWPALAVGLALLGWFPLVSHAGFFISEPPYTCALLACTLALVRLLQTGSGALRAGVWGALAWILRPQCALFFVALLLLWLAERWRQRRSADPPEPSWARHVDARAAWRFALPLLCALLVSGLRFGYYAGAPGLMAENGSMNLTAGRCHNIVTRSFSTEAERAAAAGDPEADADRRVSLPGFRALGRQGPERLLALRPALGGEHVDIVGDIGDAAPYREVRRRCYAATGLGGQLRYSLTNASLLWFVARPWPESSDHGAPHLLPVAVRARDIAALLAPFVLLGTGLGLAQLRRRTGLFLCALQLASLLLIAAIFFGTPRLRVPYDPYALILVVALALELVSWIRARRR